MAHAIWSISPLGLPKYTFSAYLPVCAMVTAGISAWLYSPDTTVPISVSNVADEDSPEPESTSLVIYAQNPPILYPCCFKPASTPRINPLVVPSSRVFLSSSSSRISHNLYPSDCIRTNGSSTLPATAMASRLTDAASTLPCWWSVWLPPTSLLPGAL